MMRERAELLARLLSADGTLWVHRDDHEGAHPKVLLGKIRAASPSRESELTSPEPRLNVGRTC